jgi:uncharacterized lipoprotein
LFFILILSGQIIGFINIKVSTLKISAIIQTVIIMLIVAAAASCSTGKEYANKVFGTKTVKAKDSAAVRFLETDSTDDYENGRSVYIKVEKPKADTSSVKKEAEEVTEPVAPPATTSTNGTRTKRKRAGE